MRPLLSSSLLLLVLLSPGAGASAQSDEQKPGHALLRVFLDCDRGCDFTYLRESIRFVDWVRHREDSDVHVLVTRQSSASGREYTLSYIGRGPFEGDEQSIRLSRSSTDTDDEHRRRLVRYLQLGLVRYALETPLAESFQLVYEPDQSSSPREPEVDPWNSWVYRVSGSASVRGEDRRDSESFSGFANASRTTDLWRLSYSLSSSYNESMFEFDDGSTFRDITRSVGLSAFSVRTLGEHWGLGLGYSARRSTFLNLDLSHRAAASIEYNIYPYSESTQRELTLAYFAGASQLDFSELTVFDKTEETFFDQGLYVGFDVEQEWGESGLDLKFSHFLDDFELNRLELSGHIEYRIVRGLSVNFSGSASRLRDQIFLPQRGATEEEILLARRALETDLTFRTGLGLTYTFGSIFNNIVNSRFSGRSRGFHRIY